MIAKEKTMKLLHRILIYANLFLVTVAAQGMNTSETQSISCTSITSSPKRTQAVSIMPATLQMPPDKNSTAYAELVNQQRLMPSTPELNKKSQLLKRSKSFSSASLSISTLQPLQTQEQIPTLNVDHVASLQATITKQEDKINWLEKALNVYMAPQKPETISLETMSAESTKKTAC